MNQKKLLIRIFLVLLIILIPTGIFFLLKLDKKMMIEKEIQELKLQEPDPSSLIWQEATSSALWEARDSFGAIVFKDKMWMMGGLDGNETVIRPNVVEYGNAKYFSDVWISENGKDWQIITDKAPWGQRRSIQLVEFKDKLWLMGGWGPYVGLRNDIWFTENGIDWTLATTTANWPAREGHQLIVFKDKLWLMGGVNYDIGKTINDVWYSEDGINWSESTSSAQWSSRWDHAVAVFNDKMWLAGGMDLKNNIYKDIWYSEDGINWILVTDDSLWEQRQGYGFVSFKNKLWIIGRFNDILNKGPNDVWYSEDGINWSKTETDPQWLGREDITALVYKDKIWIFGGMTSEWAWTNDVWYSEFPAQ